MIQKNQNFILAINSFGTHNFLFISYRIIKMFLEGKMFPYGNLSNEKWRIHTYDIVHFISNDEFLPDLMSFDTEQFFKIIAKLFYG